MHESGNKMSNRNSVPLQPSRQRLVGATREEVHILRQKKALFQTLTQEGLTAEPKSGLPTHLLPQKRRDVRPSLCNGPNIATRLTNSDPPRHSRGSSWRCIPRAAGGCSTVRCLFWKRSGGRGGGVGFLLYGYCCCVVGQAPGTKRSIVIARLVTISSSPGSDSAPEEFTDSAATGSATWMGVGSSGLSTGQWKNRFLETVSAKVSLRGTSDLTLTIQGPRSWASPTVKEGGEQISVPNVDIR